MRASAVCSCSTGCAVGRPGMSVVLTVVSWAPAWCWPMLSAIPAIGDRHLVERAHRLVFLADAVGGVYYWMKKKALFEMK